MIKPGPGAPAPLAALSHEFRTPLNAVLGMARLLEGTRLTAEQRSYVEALRQSGDHLLSLVGDVLDLAKLEAGALTLNPAPLNVDTLFQQVCELLSPRAQEKGLEIAWGVPPGLPPVLADEGRLRQVLFNLVGNAIKFTSQGGVLLGCTFERLTGRKVRLRLTVRDTGPGIDPADQQRIFEPFGSDHPDRADSTGLGLAIVKRLAHAHGGSVGVESSPGAGAAFWFEAVFPMSGKSAALRPLGGLTVVIASPSSILRAGAAAQIAAAGGRAIGCLSLNAAARTNEGSVVLIDRELFKGRRARPLAGRPCIILLPPQSRQGIGPSRAAGFAGYLIKPLRQASLVQRVLAALGRVPVQAPAADERGESRIAWGARVLLVEDNPINALLARKLLEREGCAVDLAGSAEEAEVACAAGVYDLILMDRRLPGADGATAARRLRASGVTSPIVALTADAFEEDRQACLAAGMDDFLTKPLDPHALTGLLARVLSDGWTNAQRSAKVAS